MEPAKGKYVVYALTLHNRQDGALTGWYIGITADPRERMTEHIRGKTSPAVRDLLADGAVPTFRVLKYGLTERQARREEGRLIRNGGGEDLPNDQRLNRIIPRPPVGNTHEIGETPNGYQTRRIAERLWGPFHECPQPPSRTFPPGGRRTGHPIALSAAEWETLKVRADAAGMSAAGYIRVMLGLLPQTAADCPNPQCAEDEQWAAIQSELDQLRSPPPTGAGNAAHDRLVRLAANHRPPP